jgi:uncharacterized membrane protein
VLVVASLIVGWLGIPLPFLHEQPPSLALMLAQSIEENGIDVAVSRYETLRKAGFPDVLESENQINDLGYKLLAHHQAAAAVQIFRLNTETHPRSANAFDSLGEAQIAAGDHAGAVASYRTALDIDPHFRSSDIALAKLTGIARKPYLPLVLLHISTGVAAILFGALALGLGKGGRWHRWTGNAFVVAMLFMASDGGILAAARNEPTNILGASFTLYMVLTAKLAARRREMKIDLLNYAGLAVAWVITVGSFGFALKAASEQASMTPFLGFALVTLIATVTDLRVIMAGGVTGGARIARHLWRMCAAMFIAVASFFLGQSQVVPEALRAYNLEAVPPAMVVIALVYFLSKNLLSRRRLDHARRASLQVTQSLAS